MNWKKWGIALAMSIFMITAAGCADNSAPRAGFGDEEKLKVVTTYSILYDIVMNVGGDHVEVISLVPYGANPHEYDPLPADVRNTADADAVFFNGLNLEAGNSWFEKLLATAGKTGDSAPVFQISEGVKVKFLTDKGNEGEMDPHAWLDLRNGMIYAANVRDALSAIDPDHAEDYQSNAEAYLKELEQLHENAVAEIRNIPEDQRYLVTSEGAFKYFSEAYGIESGYIWEINAESEGTPEQVQAIVDNLKQRNVKGLFVETSVDRRSMEMVSNETGIPIVGTVFTDSLASPGEVGDTYLSMMKHNIDTIVKGLQ
ncbi:metal ABC transporter substrate-binding protein [Paenibacillus senegalensis]|uniref:metal ABC transporter substrate-binding protein n=1 Tax=Paenibacillus senegalensis TaxID=1465766 RepID=UPI000287F5CF|nr:metal ABC transporter substrate-binding protein [Paenibacillus senegalensis]